MCWRWWWVVLLVWAAGSVQAQVLTLTDAQAVLQVGGTTTEKAVVLPYGWDRHQKGQQGEARFVLHFALPQVPQDAWALYLPRVGNAYEVLLNGLLLERRGSLTTYNGDDFGQLPRYVSVPFSSLRQQNVLEIHIRADVGRRGGLAPVLIGPVDDVYVLYRQQRFWNVLLSFTVLGFIGLLAVAALALWATQLVVTPQGGFQRDRLYLYAGLGELFWTLRLSNPQFESPPLAWPWWGMLPVWGLAAWSGFVAFFCMELMGWQPSARTLAFRRALVFMMVTGPLAAWAALGWGMPVALSAWYGLQGLLFIGFCIWFSLHAFRGTAWPPKAVAVAVMVNVLTALRDLYVFRIALEYPATSWVYASSVLFGLSMGYVVITQFRDVSLQARELMTSLSSRVAQRERELNSSYQRLEVLAREQERTAERTRILRDMHDGVGSHVSVAIRQLQSGRATTDDVLKTLRESLDQLKITIDVMQLPAGDVTGLLASLRYRLEPRFLASDLELQWAVDWLEPLQRMDAAAMRHLQFILLEALSNVLQHAQASCLRMEATAVAGGVCLRIVDNGRGFDPQVPPRRGLASLRDRAAAIGALLTIESAPGRTVVELVIAEQTLAER